MIIFPLYALLVWWITWKLPARWMRLLFIPVGVGFELFTSFWIIYSFPRDEPAPIWYIGLVLAFAALLASVALVITFAKPAPDHLCHACSYDLSGNEIGICPECGAVVNCRNCRHPLVHNDFGPCPRCKEPFPRFAPVSKVRDDEDDRPPRDARSALKNYAEGLSNNSDASPRAESA